MPIKLLDISTINKISAGEVIERPASVVKELVENSIDAGAKNITIEVIEGGKSLIKVIDDGSGIEASEIKMAFTRHATSKINNENDLFTITTMGFRGEALPSIAEVSKFSLISKAKGSEIGKKVLLEAGVFKEDAIFACNQGTIIEIKDLFFNLPVRKKFLKTTHTELSQISFLIEKTILAFPQIKIKLISNGKLILSSQGTGKLLDAILSVYGKDILENLIELNLKTEDSIAIKGFISKPSYLKNDRKQSSFFVNNRFIFDNILGKALKDGYKNFIPSDKYPLAIIFIEIDTNKVDVNVHPAKREVRFLNANLVFSAVKSAVFNALSKQESFTKEQNPDFYFKNNLKEIEPKKWQSKMLKPYQALVEEPHFQKNSLNKIDFRDDSETDSDFESFLLPENKPINNLKIDFVTQVYNSYIIALLDDQLVLIDQHAAHERILFNQLKQKQSNKDSQSLLIPIQLDFVSSSALLFKDFLPKLNELGFLIEDFGDNSFILRAVPSEIAFLDVEFIVLETFKALQEHNDLKRLDQDNLLKMIACKSAIKAGMLQTEAEMIKLIEQVFDLDYTDTCPHGRPTKIFLTEKDLAKMFKRT